MILKLLDYLKYKICSPFGVEKNESGKSGEIACSFSTSEYLSRIEQASLEIAESMEPVDKVIILWWGLDGLRLNEDGSLEWISRKKPEPVIQNVFYQPQQAMVAANHLLDYQMDMCQSTQATIHALQAQATMQNINILTQAQLQTYQVRYPGYYAPYFYGGLTGCCCDGTILR